jgi:dinuclear metal center YbgI/SA1388 family protein
LLVEVRKGEPRLDATVADILAALEAVAPAQLAEEWDPIGLQVGSRHWTVKRILTALDLTPAVIREVRRREGNLLVTHHPLFFKPLARLDLDTPLGSMLQALVRDRIALISAHTNLDSVQGGVNDALAALLRLENLQVLQPSPHDPQAGLGRIGRLASATALGDFAAAIKADMNLPSLRYVGEAALPVQHVALCSGSGSSLMEAFLSSEAQVFVTGDVRYHDAREIEAHGRGVIDIGHYESEHIVLETLARKLSEQIAARGLEATVEACSSERAPFQTI